MIGIDLARGLAVFGMFAVHVGPAPDDVGGVSGWLLSLTEGRSAGLFALLAGLSLALITGGRHTTTGRAGRQVKIKIAIRGFILLVLGTALTMIGTSITVILAFYGVCFVLALPFLRWRPASLAITAAVVAVAGPVLIAVVRPALTAASWGTAIHSFDPLTGASGIGVVELLVTGLFPALSWMAYVFAGLAVGRLAIGERAVQVKLAILGPVLAAVGYGGSWLSLQLTGVAPAGYVPDDGEGHPIPGVAEGLRGLLDAAPHTNTPFEIIGNIGLAIAAVGALLLVVDAAPRLRKPLWPLIAVGTMPLTVYVVQVGGLWLVESAGLDESGGWGVLLSFVVTAMLLATAWLWFFRRGPLEALVNAATSLSRLGR